MTFFRRLIGLDNPKIPCHLVYGIMGELERGYITNQQAIDALGLSGAEATEANSLLNQIVPPWTEVSLSCVGTGAGVLLTNVGTAYDAITASQNLPFFEVEASGITAVRLTVRRTKTGSGTHSYQLWNDTNGQEVVVVDDTATTGTTGYTATAVQNFAKPGLAAGKKLVRLRVKSSAGAGNDDPVVFGASVLYRRLAVLTAGELHEVLMLADHSESGLYQTEADLKARLNIA